jgi:hypothetical protein
MMHGHEKSRSAIVAVKPMNKASDPLRSRLERRAETKGNVDQQRTRRTQRRLRRKTFVVLGGCVLQTSKTGHVLVRTSGPENASDFSRAISVVEIGYVRRSEFISSCERVRVRSLSSPPSGLPPHEMGTITGARRYSYPDAGD